MDSLVVGFSRPRKWKPFAWLIMVGYSIPYDHVYIKIYSDSYERWIIYQASSTMINFMSPDIFDKQNLVIKEFEFSIPKEKKVEIIQYCIDNAGVPYGTLQVLGLIWVQLNNLFGRKILNPFRDGKQSEVCCEAAALVLEKIDIKTNIDLDTITPKELYDALVSIS